MFFASVHRLKVWPPLLMLGCGPGGLDTSAAGEGETGGGPGGTGQIGAGLGPEPAWESLDSGVATGLGFADFDGDGDADLIVSYGNDILPGPIAIYENQEGVLQDEPGWTGDRDRYHGHLSVGDLNGDGWVDVAVSVFLGDEGWDEPGGVDVYLNQGGELESVPSWSVSGFYSFSNALGDVDLDGDLDLAVAVGEAYFHEPDRSRLYLNDGSGNLGDAPDWSTEVDRHTLDVAFLDLDENGYLDLVLANHGSPHAMYSGSSEGLASEAEWEAEGSTFEGNSLDWGDLNGDGILDLVISDNEQQVGDGRVRVFCGPVLEACWESEDAPAMQSAVSLEDLDGDGLLELVAGAWRGEGSPAGRWGHFVRVYDQVEGEGLETAPSWWSTPDDIVVEAFSWADLDGSSYRENEIEGEGLVRLPARGRVLEVEGGVAGDGYISGPGRVWARYLEPEGRDLAVSDWNQLNGNLLFAQVHP